MDTLQKIVDFIVQEGTEKTSNGSWSVYPDEIEKKFGIQQTQIIENSTAIINELWHRPEIAAVEFYDHYFDFVLYLGFCKDWDGTDDWGCE